MIFKVQGTQTVTATTALTLISTANSKPRLRGYKLSQVGVVTSDSNTRVQAKRFTAAGTAGSSPTPAPTDASDPATTLFTAGSALSAEPTYTAGVILDDVGFNPRGTYTWQSEREDQDLLLPPTAANGIGFLVTTLGGSTTVIVAATVLA